jgi:hypothetical protein
MSQAQKATVHNHTELPARPDLIRLIIGIFGIGSSGPLIALSAMPVPTLIFWRNLGGSLLTLPFALRHKRESVGVKWAVIAGVLLAIHFIVDCDRSETHAGIAGCSNCYSASVW